MAEQHPCVRILRALEDVAARGVLDDAALVHDEHALGRLEDDAEVVADEDGGEALRLLQLGDRVHDRVLHEHVERGGRLVEHHESRFEREGQCDGHALTHTAGQFTREAGEDLRREPDLLDELRHPCIPTVARDVPVRLEDVDEVVADRAHRVERVHTRLQHHGEPALTLLTERFLAELADVGSPEEDLATVDAGRRLLEAGRGKTERGLPGAGLADETDELTGTDGERHVVDGLHRCGTDGLVDDGEVADLEQRSRAGGRSRCAVGLEVDGVHRDFPSRRRGLLIASTPKLMRVRLIARSAMQRPGAKRRIH